MTSCSLISGVSTTGISVPSVVDAWRSDRPYTDKEGRNSEDETSDKHEGKGSGYSSDLPLLKDDTERIALDSEQKVLLLKATYLRSLYQDGTGLAMSSAYFWCRNLTRWANLSEPSIAVGSCPLDVNRSDG